MEHIVLSKETEQACLFEAVRVLKSGGTVVLPTDTVYGLAAGVDNEQALEKVFIVKSRPKDKPLSVFVHSLEALENIASVDDPRIKEFLKEIWPGKITCVLPARGWISSSILSRPNNDITHAKQGYGVGVRMPNHPFVSQVLKGYNFAITGTSANVAGRGPYTNCEDIIREFSKLPFKPDLIIDAGELPHQKPSTVLDCTVWPPVILREGAIPGTVLLSFFYNKIERKYA